MTAGTYMTRFSEAQEELNKFLKTEGGVMSDASTTNPESAA